MVDIKGELNKVRSQLKVDNKELNLMMRMLLCLIHLILMFFAACNSQTLNYYQGGSPSDSYNGE